MNYTLKDPMENLDFWIGYNGDKSRGHTEEYILECAQKSLKEYRLAKSRGSDWRDTDMIIAFHLWHLKSKQEQGPMVWKMIDYSN